MDVEIKTADELVDAELEARWAARRGARRGDALRAILEAFVRHGGPVTVDDVQRALADWPRAAGERRVATSL